MPINNNYSAVHTWLKALRFIITHTFPLVYYMVQKYIQGHVNTCLLNLSRLIVTGKDMVHTMKSCRKIVIGLFM